MMQTSTASEIVARVSKLPALPVVTALDMLHAQGWRANAAELIAIKARADFFESEGLDRSVNIKVVDVYGGARIGNLIFNV